MVQFSPKSYFLSDLTADLCFFKCILYDLQTEAVKPFVKSHELLDYNKQCSIKNSLINHVIDVENRQPRGC